LFSRFTDVLVDSRKEEADNKKGKKILIYVFAPYRHSNPYRGYIRLIFLSIRGWEWLTFDRYEEFFHLSDFGRPDKFLEGGYRWHTGCHAEGVCKTFLRLGTTPAAIGFSLLVGCLSTILSPEYMVPCHRGAMILSCASRVSTKRGLPIRERTTMGEHR